MKRNELRRMIREELLAEKSATNKTMKLYLYLKDFTDDNGKKIRFNISETNKGMRVEIYGDFNMEDV
jgi:hypothetical protein